MYLNCVLLQQGEESEGEQVGAESVHQYSLGAAVQEARYVKTAFCYPTTSPLLIYIDNLSPVQCLHQLVAFAFPEP